MLNKLFITGLALSLFAVVPAFADDQKEGVVCLVTVNDFGGSGHKTEALLRFKNADEASAVLNAANSMPSDKFNSASRTISSFKGKEVPIEEREYVMEMLMEYDQLKFVEKKDKHTDIIMRCPADGDEIIKLK